MKNFFLPYERKFRINNSVSAGWTAALVQKKKENAHRESGVPRTTSVDWRRVKPSVNQHYGICMLFTREPPSTFVWIIPEINQCPFSLALSLPSMPRHRRVRTIQETRQMALVCPLYVRLHHSGNVTIASFQLTRPYVFASTKLEEIEKFHRFRTRISKNLNLTYMINCS